MDPINLLPVESERYFGLMWKLHGNKSLFLPYLIRDILLGRKQGISCYTASILKRPLMGGGACLVSILRIAACPVSLAQSLCHCVTDERTRNLVNYTTSNVIFHWVIRI